MVPCVSGILENVPAVFASGIQGVQEEGFSATNAFAVRGEVASAPPHLRGHDSKCKQTEVGPTVSGCRDIRVHAGSVGTSHSSVFRIRSPGTWQAF